MSAGDDGQVVRVLEPKRRKGNPYDNVRFTTLDTLAQVARATRFFRVDGSRRVFALDVCADEESACAPRFYSASDDGLSLPWEAPLVWCNPPFDDLEAWVAKAWREFAARSFDRCVMLVPARRTEQPWWQSYVEPHRDRGPSFRTYFLAGRPKFGAPGNVNAEGIGSPTFGCVLLVWEVTP